MMYEENENGILLPIYEKDEKSEELFKKGAIVEERTFQLPKTARATTRTIPEPPEVTLDPPPTMVPTKDSIQLITRTLVEACSTPDRKIVPCQQHALFAASMIAFDEHRPLVLSPDILWVSVLQGVAHHVQENAEKLRDKFVNFEGKKDIDVRRDDFVKGDPTNPWPEVFSAFTDGIKKHIGDENYDRLIVPFSTTGPVEQAAMDCALMDIVKNYFELRFHTCCGIPSITFEGEVKDYETIVEKTADIGKAYDLEWWTKHLTETLTKICLVVKGEEDGNELRHDWFNRGGGSGGPYFNGHVVRFFPYLKDWSKGYARNENLDTVQQLCMRGPGTDDIPQGIREVPFTWFYYTQKIPMKFLTGFVGIAYDEQTHAVRPEIGWGVCEAEPKKAPDMWRVCDKCGQEKNLEEMDSDRNGNPKSICVKCAYNL